jgi:hypothetical protein
MVRPTDLIGGVIEGTGLPNRAPAAMFFGCFMWEYNDIPAEKWNEIRPILKERVTNLYTAGTIRYGSW